MLHFVKIRNLPFFVEDVKGGLASCPIFVEFHWSGASYLIKTTVIIRDSVLIFKALYYPLQPTDILYKSFFYYFPFPCLMTFQRVIQLFAIFGLPAFIHSDTLLCYWKWETFWIAIEFLQVGPPTYNSPGSDKCEWYNGIIWQTLTLALEPQCLSMTHWELVLQETLHLIHALLSTATNVSPHKRLFNFQL